MNAVAVYEQEERDEPMEEFIRTHRDFVEEHLCQYNDIFDELSDDAKVVVCLWASEKEDQWHARR